MLVRLAFLALSFVLWSPHEGYGQPLQVVHMAAPARTFQFALYPMAQERGYMREEGIDLRVVQVAPTTSIQALLGGDVQFSGAGTSALMAIARANAPLKVVIASNDRVHQWLVARANITQPKDLRGKKIATNGVASISTFMLKQIMTKHGIDPSKEVNFLDPGQGNQLPALLAGTMDAAVIGIDQRYMAIDKGMKEVFYFGNEVKNSWGTVATTDRLIKEQPKMIGGFVRGIVKAFRVARQDRDGTLAAVSKYSGVTRAQAARMYDEFIGSFTRNGAVDDETQRNDLSLIRQVINSNDTVAISRGYDFSFALDADQQLTKQGWKP